jgi:DNA-binding PadR family transcriptional regulator
MNDLERQYLSAAYDLAMNDPRRVFEEYELVNDLDLDPSVSDYADRIAAIRWDLTQSGYIKPDDELETLGQVRLMLTRAGIAEAKKLADPVEQRKALRRGFLRAIYDLADGSPTEFVYWRDLASKYDSAGMARPPSPIMGAIDQLAASGLVTNEVDDGTVYRITAEGVDEVEGNRRGAQPQQNVSNVFNLSGTFYQAAVGTHNTNTFEGDLDFSTVERRIEEDGGADKEELRELVAEVRELLESGPTLDKGRLARFNDKLKQYPWLADPVAGWLLNFGTQEIGQYLN